MEVSVRPATLQDVDALSHLLARAFREDPFHRWIFPKERAWARGSHRSFALALRGEVEHGTVLTNEERQGAAIWRSPDLGPQSLGEQLRVAVPMTWLLGARSPVVFLGFARLMRLHPKEPHWYLSVLGTEPQHQGRGVGSALLQAILARCDESNIPAYLEASRPQNVPYYESRGFQVLGEFKLPKGPPIWRMQYTPPPIPK